MKLSVVILNYNVRYFLELCLKSVQKAVLDIDAEIIVVDNNSTDDSCSMVNQMFPDVTLIENKTNFGFSKGNNIGVQNAKGEYVCILNPDTVVPENGFKVLLEFAETKQDLGILGCQLIDGKGQFLPESRRNVPTPIIAIKKFLGINESYYSSVDKNTIDNVDILVGAFMLLKKEIYDAVGGFDEDYFMYGEDIDLSYKISKKGHKNYYNGEVSVIHFKGESTLRDKMYAKRFYGAMRLFYKKHFSTNYITNSLVFIGIKLMSLLPQKRVNHKSVNLKTFLFSTRSDVKYLKNIDQTIHQISDIHQIEKDCKLILDTSFLSYKTIIDLMKSTVKTDNISFRIWPKNSNFIIGSDNSVEKGEVIKF